MVDVQPKSGRDWRATAIVWGFTALFLALGYHFAHVQNVWIDESTQLLGSRLPLGTMFDWLAGAGPKLGVPEDRMPPVSYLVDAGCWASGCGSDMSFRLLHLLIATVGVIVTVRLAVSRFGWVAGVVAGALLVLSPQMTAASVEVRAYPLFFAIAAVELALFWRLVEGPALTWRRMLPFWVAALLGIYTHFFGLVMAGAYCCGLLVAKVRSRREVVMIVAVGASLLLPSLGLLPFVTGARAASDAASAGGAGPARIVTYLLRLFAGPETMLVTPLAGLFFIGLLGLLAIAVWRIGSAPGSVTTKLATPAAGVATTLVAGLAVTLGAALVVKGFDPLKTSYSIWMWPPLALLAASACVSGGARWAGRAASGSAIALVVGLAGIAGVTAAHARWFVHGPERAIAAAVPDRIASAVLYTTPQWAYGYFPIVYRFGTSFPQYVAMTDGSIRRITPGGGLSPAVDRATLDRYRHVIVAAIDLETFRDLKQRLRGGGPQRPALVAPASTWVPRGQRAEPGLYSVRVARFDKDDR